MRSLKNVAALMLPKTYRKLAKLRAVARDHEWHHEEHHRREFMRRAFKALTFNGISGDYAEFGSGTMTFALAYVESRKLRFEGRLWAFDSFEGLPEHEALADDHPRWRPGAMKTSVDDFIARCDDSGIPRSEYKVVAGYYEQTLSGGSTSDAAELPADIALAYVDCDLYSSARTVLSFLAGRMKHGMIVAFDDYFCFSDRDISGERRACLEFLGQTAKFRFTPFVQFSWHGMSFIVEDATLLDDIAQASADKSR